MRTVHTILMWAGAASLFTGSAAAHVGDMVVLTPPEPPGMAPEAPPRGPVDLLPRVPIARAAGWFLPPEPTPDDREDEAEARLEAYLDTALGHDRLEAGNVDGWYFEVGREMRQAFRPDRGRIESERRAGMNLLQEAYDEMRRYADGTEAPFGPELLPELRGAVPHPGSAVEVQEQLDFDRCNPLNGRTTWYRVDLRVTHNPEGELSAAWVLRSSGIRALDEAALEAVRTGAMTLPPPPTNVVGERQAIRSDWSFEMGDVATPMICFFSGAPTAGVSCVEDPVLGTMCSFMGRGIIRTRLGLLDVVDADHHTPEERRAARRARRALERDEAGQSGSETLLPPFRLPLPGS
ncbi:MAG: energy transducer TonB [Sandaracinaceae bacterium]